MSLANLRAAWAGALLLLAAAAQAEPRNVLILQSLERGNLALDSFTGNFRVDLDQRSAEPVTFTQVAVNPSGFEVSPEKALLDYLRAAYAGRPGPDLVMTVGGPAAVFARRNRAQLFPASPLVLAAVDQRFLASAPATDNETSVAVAGDFKGAVEDILQLLPETANVFVVMDGPIAAFLRPHFEREFAGLRGRVTFTWSGTMSLADVVHRAASLPPRSAIFFVNFRPDARGGAYPEDRVLAEIHRAARGPLFGLQSSQMGHGIVGGRLTPIDELARRAADVALRIFAGESAAAIRIPAQRRGAPVYDARELRRWGVDERRLPPGSTVLFRQPGVWERYRWAILLACAVLVAQALLIGLLLVNRAKRRRAEDALRASVTDLEVARAVLSKLSQRLMEVQEQERTRIARDLHDDVSQRMSFLAMDAARVRAMLADGAAEVSGALGALYDDLITLGRDVQAISRRLHTSKVEYLGLAAAAGSLCRETASRHGIEVDYVHERVPSPLADGVAISLFRVLQEALTNLVKHSGARRCRVTLRGSPDALTLEVADDGRGFDTATAMKGHGLGLTSMRERLKLVGGEIAVESAAGRGTTVRASVPLVSAQAVPSFPERSKTA
jgi:signal transduction histidine kinase